MISSNKYYLYVFIYSIIFLLGCSDDQSVNPIEYDKALLSINGKIENWTFGDTIKVLAGKTENIFGRGDSLYIFGSANVKADGSFLITLDKPLDTLARGYANGNYNFSDPNAKFVNILNLILCKTDGSYFKSIYNSNKPFSEIDTLNDYWAYFEYADRNVVMTGTDISLHGTEPNVDTMITTHNINYLKGWNRIVTKIVSENGTSTYNDRNRKNNMEGKWFIQN